MMPNTTENELASLLLLLARSANLTPQCPLAIFANNLLTSVERESVYNEDIKETLANQFTTLLEKQKILESQIEVILIARDKLQGELSRVESHLDNLRKDLNNVIIQRDMCKLSINALLLEPDMVQYTNVTNEEKIKSKSAECNTINALKEVVESINISHSAASQTQKQNMNLQKEENRESLLLTESGMQDENTSEKYESLQSSWSSTLTEAKEVEENFHGKADNNNNNNNIGNTNSNSNKNDYDDQDVRQLTTIHHEGINSTNTPEQGRKVYKEHNEVKWTTRRQAKQSTLVDCDDEKKNNSIMSKDSINNKNNNTNTISKKNIITTTWQDNVEPSVCCVDDKKKSLTDSFSGKNSDEQIFEHVASSEKAREATNQHFQPFQNKAIQETNAVQESKQLEHPELQEHIRDVSNMENLYDDKVYSNLLFALKTSGISEAALIQALTSFEQWAFVEYSRWADGYTSREHCDEEHVGKHNSTAHLTEEKVDKSKMVHVLESIAHHLLRMQPNIQLLELRIIKHVFTASPINDAKACLNIARILNELIKERRIIIVLTQLLNSINDDVKSAALECLLPFVCLSHSVLRATMSSQVCTCAREIFVSYDGLKYLLHIVEFNTSVTVLYRALIFLWGLLSKDDERKLAREVAQTSYGKNSTHNINHNNDNNDDNNNHCCNVAQENDAKRKFKESKIEDMHSRKLQEGSLANDTYGYDEFDVNKAHNHKCVHDHCRNNNNVESNNYTEYVEHVYDTNLSEIGDNNREKEKSLIKNSYSNYSNKSSVTTNGSYIHRVIRELGGLQAVIPLLYTDTLVLLENVCMVIGYMTRDEENKTEMRECGGLEKLTATLHHPSLSIKAKIAGAIWNCSSNATNRTHLRHIGTISSLLQLLYVNSLDFINSCKFKGISMASVNSDVKTNKLIDKNFHEVVSREVMTENSNSSNNSSSNNNNSDGISSNDESKTYIRTTGFSKSNVNTNGSRKNSNINSIISDKITCVPIADNAASTIDVKTTCTSDDANNSYMSNSAYCCTDKNNTDVMYLHNRQSDKKKVRWTAEEREEIEFVRENVTGALWNISLDVENKLFIIKYNGFIDLLALLTESTKLTVVENASGTLWNCSALYEARRIIDECDGVSIMLAYLHKYVLRQNLEEEDKSYHSSEKNVNYIEKKILFKNLKAYCLEKEARCSYDNSAKAFDCNQHHLEQQQEQQHEEKEGIYHDIATDIADDSKNTNRSNNKIITLKKTDNISEHEHSTTERRLGDKLSCFWNNDAPMPCNCKIAENILGILRNCAVIDTSKSALLEYSSIPIFIECLRIWAYYNAVSHKRAGVFLSDNAIERITSILWILSISAEGKHEIRKCGGLELLIEILMMSSPTEHGTKICAEKSIITNQNHEITCDSIACKTEEVMQSSLSKRQWQEILYCVTSINTANIDNNSSDNLAKFTACLKAVSSAEPAIPLHISIREKIVGIIRNCSTLQENKEPLLKYHAVKCLVAVVLDCYSPWAIFTNNEASHGKCSKLDVPSAQLKETVASAIWHLAKENKEVVRVEDGLELMCLFVAMPQETTLILEQATGALSSLTMNNIENRIALREYDTFRLLMQRIIEYTLQHDNLHSQTKETGSFTSKKTHKSSNSNNDIERDSSLTVKDCANYIVANSIVTLRNCMINNNANVKECGKISMENNCAFLGAVLELIKGEPAELTKELLLLLRYLCSIKEVSQHVAELHGSAIVSSVNSNKLSETARRAIQYILQNLKRIDS